MAYDQDRQHWAAGAMKSMREERNCGMSSNVFGDFVEEVERTESAQSSIVLQSPDPLAGQIRVLPSPAPPDDGIFTKQNPTSPTAQPLVTTITAELAKGAPLWKEEPAPSSLKLTSPPVAVNLADALEPPDQLPLPPSPLPRPPGVVMADQRGSANNQLTSSTMQSIT